MYLRVAAMHPSSDLRVGLKTLLNTMLRHNADALQWN